MFQIGLEASNFAADNPVSSSIWTGRIQVDNLLVLLPFEILFYKLSSSLFGLKLLIFFFCQDLFLFVTFSDPASAS